MKFDLLNYMSKRIKSATENGKKGAVVTNLRQFGCSAKSIAKLLSHKIKEKHPGIPEWQWINKEIFENVAKELEVSKDRVLHVFEGEKKDFFWDLFRGFSEKYYTSDITIRNKLGILKKITIHSFHCGRPNPHVPKVRSGLIALCVFG